MKNIEAIRVILGITENIRGKQRKTENNRGKLRILEENRGKLRILEFLSDLPSSAQKFSPKIPKKLPKNSRRLPTLLHSSRLYSSSSRLCAT